MTLCQHRRPLKHVRDYVLGVGANLGSRAATVRAALDLLASDAATTLVAVSSVYESAALGPPGPPYYNLAVRLRSSHDPDALWETLARVEAMLGRVRRERWASRTIDLDVLWCEEPFTSSSLTVPHPELERRWFALAPLLEVAPEAEPRYAAVLAALGGAPVTGAALDALARSHVVEADAELWIESRAADRADALAEALRALAAASGAAAPSDEPYVVQSIQAHSVAGEELAAFVRAVLALGRRGRAPARVVLGSLGAGQAEGRALTTTRAWPAWTLLRAEEAPEPPGHRVGLAFSRRITDGQDPPR